MLWKLPVIDVKCLHSPWLPRTALGQCNKPESGEPNPHPGPVTFRLNLSKFLVSSGPQFPHCGISSSGWYLRSLPVLKLSLTQRSQCLVTQPSRTQLHFGGACFSRGLGWRLICDWGCVAVGCLRPGLERGRGQEEKREGTWEEDRVNSELVPCCQPRSDRLRWGELLHAAFLNFNYYNSEKIRV